MSRVKTRDNPLERFVRTELHRKGYRFRTHLKTLPGRPDIVLIRYKVVVFIDGDFWHGYRFPMWEDKLQPFWKEKISTNRRRDAKNFRKLRRAGWTVIRVWEHELKRFPDRVIERLVSRIG
jgi:DNA mismatch endonuclease (patch repair protein)